MSAAPNALTECQRVRGERRSESDGRTAGGCNAFAWRRVSESPWAGEGRSPNGPTQ